MIYQEVQRYEKIFQTVDESVRAVEQSDNEENFENNNWDSVSFDDSENSANANSSNLLLYCAL